MELKHVLNKLKMMIGRYTLTAIDSTQQHSNLQVEAFDDEVFDDVEYIEPYGFTSIPKLNSEAITLLAGANRQRPIVICLSDKQYRPTDLENGDVCIYNSNGSRITLKESGVIDIQSNDQIRITSNSKISLHSKKLDIKSNDVSLIEQVHEIIDGLFNLKYLDSYGKPCSIVPMSDTKLNMIKNKLQAMK